MLPQAAILFFLLLRVTWLFSSLEGQLPSPCLLHWVTHDPQISHPPKPLLSSAQLSRGRSKARLSTGMSLWGWGLQANLRSAMWRVPTDYLSLFTIALIL